MNLTFDEATHTYALNGQRVPSVTGVLGPIMPDYSRADPTTGTEVHRLTAEYDAHALAEGEVPNELRGYLSAWIAFREDNEFHPVHIEERVANTLLRYAGTVDRIGVLGAGGEPLILDIKTGDPDRWHGAQLAGYVMAAERMGMVARDVSRWGVYLQSDGQYQVRSYLSTKDFAVFQAALYLATWKETPDD